MRLRHEPLEIVDKTFPAVLGVLVVAADVNSLLRTNLLAVATENAPELVDLEDQRIAVPFLVLALVSVLLVRRHRWFWRVLFGTQLALVAALAIKDLSFVWPRRFLMVSSYGLLAIVAAHLVGGLQADAERRSLGTAEQLAAQFGVELNARHPGRLAIGHAGDGPGD